MNNQEAIEEIKHNVFVNTDDCEMRISKECYKLLINAMEKQTAKKVVRKPNINHDYEIRTCPSCGGYISRLDNTCYCDCGQRLDWRFNE